MIIRNDCLYGSNDLDKIVDSFASNNRAKPKRLSEPGDWCSVIDERTTNSFAWSGIGEAERPMAAVSRAILLAQTAIYEHVTQ